MGLAGICGALAACDHGNRMDRIVFYFIALDLGLRQAPDLPKGAHGEEWQVHGGGFYHIRKYLVAPERMPEHLTWFKWESYSTWLSGAALLMIVYWAGGELYLIDAAKAIYPVSGHFDFGWIIGIWLDCLRSIVQIPLGETPTLLMVLLFVLLVVMGWGYNQVFTGRATLLHLGAFTATIMSANVFFVIIPNQKIVVTDLIAGRAPDPKYGKIAKLRSTHNNYLTLPVIFFMLSNHYPLAFASEYNWIIAALVFLMGVTIRHYFHSLLARRGNPIWTRPATIFLFFLIMWLSTAPLHQDPADTSELSARQDIFATAVDFEEAQDIVMGRCSMCHAREPVYDGFRRAPNHVFLETTADITQHAKAIYLQSGVSHAMPPANVSWMEEDERLLIRQWYRNAMDTMPLSLALK